MINRHSAKTGLFYLLLVLAALLPTAYAMKTWQSAPATSGGQTQLPALLEFEPHEIKTPVPPQTLWTQNRQLFQEWLLLEPTAGQIQQVMIRYADLHPEKISRWQMQSRLRALIPTLSFGKDYSRGNNIDLDRGSTSEPDVYIFGPDEIDEGWDFDVSWDLGDLIWSSNQNSIEYRNKQLNDQRQYILSEGMHLYFERRRAQMQIWAEPAANAKEHYDRLLRIDELTALLDILTGGYLSRQIDTIYQNHPHLKALWEFASPESAA